MTYSEQSDQTHPKVTVIVPVYEDLERLRTCVTRLASQDYPGAIEVIVVDNNSHTDLSPALPTGDDRFRLIRETKKGSYAARNAGLKLITGDIVAFTDADCLPHGDWISSAVAILEDASPPDAVGGAINLVYRAGPDPTTGPELYESIHGFDQRQFVETFHFAATANLITTRRMLEIVGPFNDELQSGGDDDWGRRLRQAGGRLVYSDEVIVDHPSRPTWSELTTKSVRVARGMAGLAHGQSLRDDAKELLGEVRAGTAVWVSIWRKDWPPTVRGKIRYAAAMSWVSSLRCAERLKFRLAHGRSKSLQTT